MYVYIYILITPTAPVNYSTIATKTSAAPPPSNALFVVNISHSQYKSTILTMTHHGDWWWSMDKENYICILEIVI